DPRGGGGERELSALEHRAVLAHGVELVDVRAGGEQEPRHGPLVVERDGGSRRRGQRRGAARDQREHEVGRARRRRHVEDLAGRAGGGGGGGPGGRRGSGGGGAPPPPSPAPPPRAPRPGQASSTAAAMAPEAFPAPTTKSRPAPGSIEPRARRTSGRTPAAAR